MLNSERPEATPPQAGPANEPRDGVRRPWLRNHQPGSRGAAPSWRRGGWPGCVDPAQLPQHVVAFYAVLRLGGVVAERNLLYTARWLRHQFEEHQARVVIFWDKAVAAISEFPAGIGLDRIVSVDLLAAFPALKRLALHLPAKKRRATRAALSGPDARSKGAQGGP